MEVPKDSARTSSTAIASPRARPMPSMTAPTMPPLAKGITTLPMTLALVAPRASAPSRSPDGVREMISRLMDVTIGMIMIATRIPAIRYEPVKTVVPGVTRKMGTKDTWTDSHLEIGAM